MKTGNKEIGFGKNTISKVFSEWYTVPSYQRHYVWDSDNVNDLLNDFNDNYKEHGAEEYFLGSYIIQNKVGDNDLLDGQQRITTLFLLFAFLRDYDKSSSDVKSACKELIFQEGNKVKKIEPRVRLNYEIRGNVKKFVDDYIRQEGSITAQWESIAEKAADKNENPSIQRMCNALCCYDTFFKEHPEIDLDEFVTFILNNVVMIFISADSLEDAFRLFSVMNDRGQKLSNSDILKSSNLEKISNDCDRNYYAREWEDMQADLGNDFDRLLAYVRTMILKKRQRNNLLDEYEKLIFNQGVIAKGKTFFDYVFKAYEDYNKIIALEGNTDSDFCTLIRTLNASMPSTDWIPVILAYYRKFKEKGLKEFTQLVACKNIADAVCGKSPSQRIDDLNDIINLVDEKNDYEEILTAKQYYAFKTEIFLANIQSDIYGRRYTLALLMLLEYKYKDKTEWKEFGTISIEHILPQNPKPTSQWVQDFTEEERSTYTHKLGNLCLIGRRKNSSLGNLDYQEKLKRYFEKNIGSFANTQKIYKTYPDRWTPTEVQENQERVVRDLKEIFGIPLSSGENIMSSTSITVSASIHQNSLDLEEKPMTPQEKAKAEYGEMAYEYWTDEEEQKLIKFHDAGYSNSDIAKMLQRQPSAIEARLKKIEMRNQKGIE